VYLWHRIATNKVVAEIERIVGRQAHNGKEHLERTGNMAAAVYEHDSSRCQEAQLHSHVVVMNVTRSANGRRYAIDFREFMDQSDYLTAIYWDEMARQAREAGLHITVGEHGQPEITELMDMAKEHLSRSKELAQLVEQIEEYAGTKLSDREAGILARASRGFDVEKFAKLWEANKAELDALKTLDPETAEQHRRALLERFRVIVQQSSESRLKKITTPEVRSEQQARVTPEQRQSMEMIKATRAREHPIIVPDLDVSIQYALAR
jgi:hypothetical protein